LNGYITSKVNFKYNTLMKNIIKAGLIAITVLLFAACSSKKAAAGTDSTRVKIDSTVKTTTTDSTRQDTAKKDSSKM